jgi:hypothetical protein
MEAASKKIMLERLREEWTDVVDPSVYCEMELEKQMWMLTALRSFDGPGGLDRLGTGISVFEEGIGKRRETGERGGNLGRREREESRKVLSLFENHGKRARGPCICGWWYMRETDEKYSVGILSCSYDSPGNRAASPLYITTIPETVSTYHASDRSERHTALAICIKHIQHCARSLLTLSPPFLFHSNRTEGVPSRAHLSSSSTTTACARIDSLVSQLRGSKHHSVKSSCIRE